MSFVGIDVGGTHVRSARLSGAEEAPRLDRAEPLPGDYASFLGRLTDLIGPDADGVGVGLPGRTGGDRAAWIPNVPYLDGRAVAADLAARVGAPVTLINDGQAALLGEARFGAARDVADALLVTVGTGIGGAVLRRGRIVRGANGTAGAFGWLPVGTVPAGGRADEDARDAAADDAIGLDADAGAEEAGESGPFERRASGRALAARARRLDPPLAGRDLLPAARAGRADAAAVLDDFVRDLGTGLAALASVFDPQRILVSGGVSELVAELLPDLRAAVAAAASPSVRGVEIRIARHGPRAGAFGAAALAREGEGAFLA